jgi:hypothetical protein
LALNISAWHGSLQAAIRGIAENICSWRAFRRLAELGRNVNERLEAVVRDAAVIGDRKPSPPSEQIGSALPRLPLEKQL